MWNWYTRARESESKNSGLKELVSSPSETSTGERRKSSLSGSRVRYEGGRGPDFSAGTRVDWSIMESFLVFISQTLDPNILIVLSGELLDDNEHWQIYCTVETESECFNMATFRRKGYILEIVSVPRTWYTTPWIESGVCVCVFLLMNFGLQLYVRFCGLWCNEPGLLVLWMKHEVCSVGDLPDKFGELYPYFVLCRLSNHCRLSNGCWKVILVLNLSMIRSQTVREGRFSLVYRGLESVNRRRGTHSFQRGWVLQYRRPNWHGLNRYKCGWL